MNGCCGSRPWRRCSSSCGRSANGKERSGEIRPWQTFRRVLTDPPERPFEGYTLASFSSRCRGSRRRLSGGGLTQEGVELALDLLTRQAVLLLDLAHEHVVVALDLRQIVVGQ